MPDHSNIRHISEQIRLKIADAVFAETHESHIKALHAALQSTELLRLDLEAELKHLGASKYYLRYTNDLYVVASSWDLEELKTRAKGVRDFKVHIIDHGARCVWQSSESERYGRTGLDV